MSDYYDQIRSDIMESLDAYVSTGRPTGGFLESVLCNNLMEAVGRADPYNLRTLHQICSYIYNELPANCHGSAEIVRAWYERKAMERENAETIARANRASTDGAK
jgi:hypothetical protein